MHAEIILIRYVIPYEFRLLLVCDDCHRLQSQTIRRIGASIRVLYDLGNDNVAHTNEFSSGAKVIGVCATMF